MKITEKLAKKQKDKFSNAPVTIAFIGDSVTQGCFECYRTHSGMFDTVYDPNFAYSQRVREILNMLYPSAQVNVINSGISGDKATEGIKRFNRDVAAYKPDLVVISYGLNDSVRGIDNIQNYLSAVGTLIDDAQAIGAEVIFLTQNRMCDKISKTLTDATLVSVAEETMPTQNGNVLKEYFDKVTDLCKQKGVAVCDTYSKWEAMFNGGVDTTELLANKINHPIREMHYYVAIKLIETMFTE